MSGKETARTPPQPARTLGPPEVPAGRRAAGLIDPRPALIRRRLAAVPRIVVFSSGKGGVGKSFCAATAGLLLARSGLRTGILDLDFQGASIHLFLGSSLGFPEERGGILPLESSFGLRFMSIAAFTGERAVPLRGSEVTAAILELLAVTVWDETECLVVDMPPGIGDEILDVLRFMPGARIVVVSTPSVVSTRVVGRLVEILRELTGGVAGVLENMVDSASPRTRPVGGGPGRSSWDVPLLGRLPWSPEIEEAIGFPERLVATAPAKALEDVLATLTES